MRLFSENEKQIEVVMSILSNYVPGSRVKAWVSCPISDLGDDGDLLAQKFVQALQIAHKNPYRAVTHNKGIMNGIDALAIATGNDFRAIEAGIHAYAAQDGQYRGLSKAWIKDDTFWFELEVPLAVGTVGGLTKLHPMVKWSHELLQSPNAEGTYANHGRQRISAKLCRLALLGHDRHSEGTYENAFAQYSESNGCNQS
jgi:hydroxymethylglutaryl-CoA reductase